MVEARNEKLRAEIETGCREMWDEMLEIEREFHPLEEEVERKYGEKRSKGIRPSQSCQEHEKPNE